MHIAISVQKSFHYCSLDSHLPDGCDYVLHDTAVTVQLQWDKEYAAAENAFEEEVGKLKRVCFCESCTVIFSLLCISSSDILVFFWFYILYTTDPQRQDH